MEVIYLNEIGTSRHVPDLVQWVVVEKMFGVRVLCEYENYWNQNYCDQANFDKDP
jgi:hypothetical protein